jgi:thiopeptide-type bacteriocin biosynthesis protein
MQKISKPLSALEAKRYCLYFKIYLPESCDKFSVLRSLAPLFRKYEKPFPVYFFVWYKDKGGFHIRLRFFGQKSHIMGAPRKALLNDFSVAARNYHSKAVIKESRYLPEFKRYGGRAGVWLHELISHVSTKTIVDFASLAKSKKAIGKAEFAVVTAEILLDSLGVSEYEKKRYVWFQEKFTSLEIDGNAQAIRIFVKMLKPVIHKYKRYSTDLYRDKNAAAHLILTKFRQQIASLLPLYQSITADQKDLKIDVLPSYVHMHFNRLGLSNLEESIIRITFHLLQKSESPCAETNRKSRTA